MKKNNNDYSSNFSLKLYSICQKMPFIRYFKVVLYFIDFFLLLFIKKPKTVINKKKKVLIIYNFAFGDGIIFLSSFRNIRKIYPSDKYDINIICQKGINSLYENEKIFDKVISYPLTKATFNLKERFNLFKLLRKEYYDIVIDPIGVYECTTNIFMSRAIVAKEKISVLDITLRNRMCPRWMSNRIYNNIFEITIPRLSLIEYYFKFFNFLADKDYNVKLDSINVTYIKMDIPDNYFIIFPSASTLLKRWPIDRYASVAKKIHSETGLPILYCGTSSDENSINELKLLLNNIPSYDFVNKSSLLEFIEIVKRAKVVITNDTSTYHIAVVNQTPVAIITGGYTYDRYVKYEFENAHKYKQPCIIVNEMDCFNCDNKCHLLKSDDKIWPCLNLITEDYAWDKIYRLLEKENLLKKRK